MIAQRGRPRGLGPTYLNGMTKWVIEDALQDEFVMPVQFWNGTAQWSPVQRLHAALLWNVIETWRVCAGRMNTSAQRQCVEIHEWLDGADAPISFVAVCASLGFDPEATRRLCLHAAARTRGRGYVIGPLPTPTINRERHSSTAF